MKGEVYGKRDLSPLVGMDKQKSKPSGSSAPKRDGNKPNTRKRK
jgi:small subunit ribosomal protein S3